MMIDAELLTAVQELTLNLPLKTAKAVAEVLTTAPSHIHSDVLRTQLHKNFNAELQYRQVNDLIKHMVRSKVTPGEIGYAILAAAEMDDYHRHRQTLDLLWTGPETSIIPVRRNDQALLDVIEAAQETLYIVSFAIYNIEGIQAAIKRALDRNVQVHMFMEFPQPDPDTDKLGYNTVKAFGIDLALRCQMYEWVMEKRPFKLAWNNHQKTEKKKYATLHAKLAVADKAQLFISSANLTEYAMLHKIEMGVLIKGGDEPGRVRKHLQSLVATRDFVPKTKDEIRAFEQ
jgi:phosphatidylserine/phosphatidylglycerophosphate/cardiolipin synthase-like enzyme